MKPVMATVLLNGTSCVVGLAGCPYFRGVYCADIEEILTSGKRHSRCRFGKKTVIVTVEVDEDVGDTSVRRHKS